MPEVKHFLDQLLYNPSLGRIWSRGGSVISDSSNDAKLSPKSIASLGKDFYAMEIKKRGVTGGTLGSRV